MRERQRKEGTLCMPIFFLFLLQFPKIGTWPFKLMNQESYPKKCPKRSSSLSCLTLRVHLLVLFNRWEWNNEVGETLEVSEICSSNSNQGTKKETAIQKVSQRKLILTVQKAKILENFWMINSFKKTDQQEVKFKFQWGELYKR